MSSLKDKLDELRGQGYFDCGTCVFRDFCEASEVCIDYVSYDFKYGNVARINEYKEVKAICPRCRYKAKRRGRTLPEAPYGMCPKCGEKLVLFGRKG